MLNAYYFGFKMIKINCERYFYFLNLFGYFKEFLDVEMTFK